MAVTEALARPWVPPRGRTEPTRAQKREAEALERILKRRIAGEVRFDSGSRALYATDLSIYRQAPIGVVIPKSADDVEATVASCRERDIPILGRGCGTSLCGQCCNVAVVLDFSKYLNRIVAIDPGSRTARVEPGVINAQLRQAANAHGLTFAPDPATNKYCTLGGNIGNNSCGAHTVTGGKTVDNVEELDILTYDGLRLRVGATADDAFAQIQRAGGRRAEIYRRLRRLRDRYGDEIRKRYPHIPRRVSGYNLDDLLPEKGFHVARALVGSESTCALTLGATVRLLRDPPARVLLLAGFPDMAAAADHGPELREYGAAAIEAFERHGVENMKKKGHYKPGIALLPEGAAWIMAEFAGDAPGEVEARAEQARARLLRGGAVDAVVIADREQQEQVWLVRENGVGSSRVPGIEETWPSWEDAAVPPERLGDYLRDFVKLNEKYGYKFTLFGHLGDGCMHSRMNFGLKTEEGVARFRAYMQEASDLCLAYGGSLSGEHGDGQAKGELLPKMFGPELIEAFRDFKAIWDPAGKMNPGKVIDAYPLDTNLRLGPGYRPKPVETWFKYPDDNGSFAHAAERCFGVGKCRSLGGHTMCPSFQATREEMHSTRGRAHLLFEMMRGDQIKEGWRDPHIREALDLCLQCKGCKGDCPVSVDMATYKAEFLAHYYRGRLRPRAAYAMGLIFRWARLAALAPGLTNAVTHAPVLRAAVRMAGGFNHERELPEFAPQTFRAWFRRRKTPEGRTDRRREVVLWADTFNNHFTPHTAQAAVEVLEAAGYRVSVPRQSLCCGRPLYDYGMLDLAKRKLRQTMTALRPALRRGTPIVVLEPSCASVFRDELVNLFPDDADARRLSRQVVLLSELLAEDKHYRPPKLERYALMHAHCHHKAVFRTDAEKMLLEAVGVDLETPETGCCGLAGSFGYEAGHYEVSVRIGENMLLPAVRRASPRTLIVADGFSCRLQIEHATGRKALHPAEVLQMALRYGRHGPAGSYPESGHTQEPAKLSAIGKAGALVGAALVAGLAVWGAGRMSRALS